MPFPEYLLALSLLFLRRVMAVMGDGVGSMELLSSMVGAMDQGRWRLLPGRSSLRTWCTSVGSCGAALERALSSIGPITRKMAARRCSSCQRCCRQGSGPPCRLVPTAL